MSLEGGGDSALSSVALERAMVVRGSVQVVVFVSWFTKYGRPDRGSIRFSQLPGKGGTRPFCDDI